MRINSIKLNNFRSFKKREFKFNSSKTIVVGPNASGKSNLLEALYMLSTGHSSKSFRDIELIHTDKDFTTIEGAVEDVSGTEKSLILQVIRTDGGRGVKKLKVNGIGRSLSNFAGALAAVIFEPEDIQLVLGSPDLRRTYLNNVLSFVSRGYRRALLTFDSTRRSRNRLLESIREGDQRISSLEFWDEKLLELSPIISDLRCTFFEFLSSNRKDLAFSYHQSVLSRERLTEYQSREIASATTLIGPHRDDFSFGAHEGGARIRDLSIFGSRGEQRMAVFALKMLEISFLEKNLGSRPLLLLDDIFSELDRQHRLEITSQLEGSQVIITTTEKEFASTPHLLDCEIIFID